MNDAERSADSDGDLSQFDSSTSTDASIFSHEFAIYVHGATGDQVSAVSPCLRHRLLSDSPDRYGEPRLCRLVAHTNLQ